MRLVLRFGGEQNDKGFLGIMGDFKRTVECLRIRPLSPPCGVGVTR
jgi:hypothetical protein